MTIDFQYTLDDLKEAHAAHTPKVPPKRASAARVIAIMFFAIGSLVMFVLLAVSSREASSSPSYRPALLDLALPVIAIVAFLIPWQTYRSLRSSGAKATLQSRGFIAAITWVVAAVLLVILWRMLSRSTPPSAGPAVAGDPEPSSWHAVSNFLIPHATWLLLLAASYIRIIRHVSQQTLSIWQGSPALHRPYTMTVTDDGITFAEPLARHDLKWFAFDRVIETQNLFLLYIAEHMFHMVPKRAFADPRQIDEFRATIDNRITRRPTAFPVLPVAG